MLLEFSCSNHKSIRKKVLFSAIATPDTSNEENLIPYGKDRILKSAVIYGANGSGKTNLLSAISYVKMMVMNSIGHQPNEKINQMPHKLEGFDKDSTYAIQFTIKDIRYAYGFTLTNRIVTDEYLYYFPKGRQVCVFERNQDGVIPGNSFRNAFNTCKDVLKPNRLMLSCAANFSSVKETEDAYRFFAEDLVIYNPDNQNDWMNYSLYQIAENKVLKNTILDFMRSLDINIRDIKVKINRTNFKHTGISLAPPVFSEDFNKSVLNKDKDSITARIVYDEFETDLLYEESSGIQKLVSLLCPLIDVITNGKIMLCDELESGLHESLVYGLIKEFMKSNHNGQQAQIFFTAHETAFIDTNLFRRDQIWFTEMKKEGRETDLYSLAELKNIRKEENFGRGYISGRYGAIPMLNIDFANLVSSM
ncbi:MAG: ATP-binding protein [Clostridia bacterium]|nr:ATP-binding protein [Clostridia bacterium]